MDFQHILKEKHLNNIINNHVNFLNNRDKMKKILHQIKFSKSLKLIDPYYKINERKLLNYKNHSMLYRRLLEDYVKYYDYKKLNSMNLYEMKKSIDNKIFRKIEKSLWENNNNNYMILNFMHRRSISHMITRRCFFNLQYVELCIEANRQDYIKKNYFYKFIKIDT